MAQYTTVRSATYRNGGFGDNTASIEAVTEHGFLPDHWLFRNGYGDPCFEPTLESAEAAFESFMAGCERVSS